MKRLLFIILLLGNYCCFSQENNDFQNWLKSQEKDKETFIDDHQKEYENYVKKEQEAYNKFLKARELQWGKNNVKESTQTDWVEYSKDGTSRSIVDFEKGEATIEIIQEPGKKVDNKEIEEQLKVLLTNKGKTKDYDSEVEKALPLQNRAVLENQVMTPSGEIVTEQNLDKNVKEIVQNTKPEIQTIKGNDNNERQVVIVKFDLAPDYIKTRAEQYKNEVQKYCQKWDISPALVYSIMQTESSFNPKAKSHVPAYGLMQIVPKSAGADCAKSLKKPFEIPSGNYLYEPENNIEMGVHYLYLLKNRYFTKVNNKNSQTLCIIASYNTGAGNVARALRGDTNISKAIPQINTMSYEQLFKYFEENLVSETKDYIRKVTQRTNSFQNWLK